MSAEGSRSKPWRWILTRAGVALALLLVALVGIGLALDEPRPTGEPGPAAEALAAELEAAIDLPAWEGTQAVRWRFAERHAHLWDRARGLARVRFDDTEVQLRLADQRGVALQDGEPVLPADEDELVREAYAMWANDSFWLNPLAKLHDPGTVRERVELAGEDALLIRYTSGGVTPGDAYLWLFGPGEAPRRPRAWRMWVSILPIGGLEVPWDGWQELSTGAWVATEHPFGPVALRLTDVEGAASLAELEEGEPFAALLRRLE